MIQWIKEEAFGLSSSLVALIGRVIESRKLRIESSQRCLGSQRYQTKLKTVNSEVKFFWLKLSMSLHDVTVLNVSWGQAWYCRVGSPLVSLQFSRRTARWIFLIFCMNVPYYKGKKRTRRFFREKSCSLIIHKNRF